MRFVDAYNLNLRCSLALVHWPDGTYDPYPTVPDIGLAHIEVTLRYAKTVLDDGAYRPIRRMSDARVSA